MSSQDATSSKEEIQTRLASLYSRITEKEKQLFTDIILIDVSTAREKAKYERYLSSVATKQLPSPTYTFGNKSTNNQNQLRIVILNDYPQLEAHRYLADSEKCEIYFPDNTIRQLCTTITAFNTTFNYAKDHKIAINLKLEKTVGSFKWAQTEIVHGSMETYLPQPTEMDLKRLKDLVETSNESYRRLSDEQRNKMNNDLITNSEATNYKLHISNMGKLPVKFTSPGMPIPIGQQFDCTKVPVYNGVVYVERSFYNIIAKDNPIKKNVQQSIESQMKQQIMRP
ncbi:MAG: hypothetical protein J6X70_06310 [Muribaculaceae bacterium]|nr:hypothetical protein [Muribaculaceae bacterium]